MTHQITKVDEVRQVFQRLQDYYTRRDLALLDEFMEMLDDEGLEVIGTNGLRPGEDEWYLGKEAARDIFQGDWESWGDVRLDVEAASIQVSGEAAWLSAFGTVAATIKAEENCVDFLEYVKEYIDSQDLSAEQKLLYILRGGSNTIYELRQGEKFVWALRFTAVLIQRGETWKFRQMHFSFPTIYFPDVRLLEKGL